MRTHSFKPLLTAFAILMSLSSVTFLAGCGFVPLYAQNGTLSALSSIDVETPQTRLGSLLRQELINGFGEGSALKTYRLEVSIKETRYDVGLSVQGVATRFELSNAVTYKLIKTSDQSVVIANSFTDTVTFDATENPYAGVAGQKDAQARASVSIAEKIRSELAVHFHTRPV